MLLLLSALAVAAPTTPVTLTGQLGAVIGPPSYGGDGSGDIALNLGRAALVAGGREGYATGDPRSIGGIEILGRYWLGDLSVQGGFFHFHETPKDVLADNPLLAVIGSAPGIRHRSGLGVGAAYDMTLVDVFDDRLGAVVETNLVYFPDPSGPAIYVLVDFGFSIDVGKPD